MTEPVEVTIEDAYREACLALGEEVVQRRFMARAAAARIAKLEAQMTDSEGAPS